MTVYCENAFVTIIHYSCKWIIICEIHFFSSTGPLPHSGQTISGRNQAWINGTVFCRTPAWFVGKVWKICWMCRWTNVWKICWYFNWLWVNKYNDRNVRSTWVRSESHNEAFGDGHLARCSLQESESLRNAREKTIGCCWEVCSEENVMKQKKSMWYWTAKCYHWVCAGLGSFPA